MTSKEKHKGYTKLIELTVYKLIGCKDSNLSVKTVKTKKQIQAIALEFRAELEKRSKNVNYIKTSFALVVNKVKHFYKGETNKPTVKNRLAWIKETFNVTEQELLVLKTNYTKKVQSRLDSKNSYASENSTNTDTLTNINLLIDNAKKMLLSAKYQEVATAISLFTGRRMIEVLLIGSFLPSKKKNTIKFIGAAKKGYNYDLLSKDTIVYEIPTLIDSSLILNACKRLEMLKSKETIKEQVIENRKKLIEFENLPKGFISELEVASLFNDNFNKTINQSAFLLLNSCVKKVGNKKPTYHDLRKIYFTICIEKIRKPNETIANYAKKVLLHDTTETGQTYDTWVIDNIASYQL
jgi:hypothetical protein